MRADPLTQLRSICLALPESGEKEAWGAPTFRVAGKMMVMFVDNHHGDGRVAMWCKAPPGVQEILVGADPKRFFVPPYVGHKGWIGMRLEGAGDWSVVADLVKDAHRMAAPKRLAALHDQDARLPKRGAESAQQRQSRRRAPG